MYTYVMFFIRERKKILCARFEKRKNHPIEHDKIDSWKEF